MYKTKTQSLQVLFLLFFVGSLHAQPIRRTVPTPTNLTTLQDEFNDPSSLTQWKQFYQEEGFPDMARSIRIENGTLMIEPGTSGWYADLQAPFLFKEITGNFDVQIRVKASGKHTSLPQTAWSLGGLMVREPKPTKKENWQPNQQNWLFITTGIAEPLAQPVFEVKTTTNSGSNLKLRPALEGWVSMRIVKLGGTFLLMYRYKDTDEWLLLERFYRPRTPATLQVGINAYTDYASAGELLRDPFKFNTSIVEHGKPDLILYVDYFRIKEVKINDAFRQKAEQYKQLPFYTAEHLLTDFSISNEEVLKAIGD